MAELFLDKNNLSKEAHSPVDKYNSNRHRRIDLLTQHSIFPLHNKQTSSCKNTR